MRGTHAVPSIAALCICVALAGCAPDSPDPRPATAAEQAPGSWPYYGGDLAFNRYSALDQIDRDNVDQVQVLWRRPAIEPSLLAAHPDLAVNNYQRATPVLSDGVLFAPNAVGLVEAFDPATGETLWVQAPESEDDIRGRSSRGVAVWSSGAERRLIAVRGSHLYALDPDTGDPISGFGDDGRVLLDAGGRYGWSSGPIVVGDVAVVGGTIDGAGDSGSAWRGSAPENIRGFDVQTGRLRWTFNVVPDEGELGADSWGGARAESGDLGSWCCLSADESLGHVYVPLSAPTSAYYGGHRPGDNLFSNSLVALDAATGERVWHYQMVHHDIWEYDTVGPPVLGRIEVDGRSIDAVMQASKTAFLYTFDRRTGEPVWPIEEIAVAQSNVPGEATSPTQPIPSRPPAFDRQGTSPEDLIDFTPEIRERARGIGDSLVFAQLFDPPMQQGSIEGKIGTYVVPGAWGAGNWNTGAFDPETGVYYAVSATLPDAWSVTETDDPEAMAFAVQGGWKNPTVDGLLLVKPPWGRITAIDMNRGEHMWMVANGDGPNDHPLLEGLDLPPLGNANRPAPLVTRTLLFIGEGSDAVIGTPVGHSGDTFRAYDKATGEVVWSIELPSGTTGGPMSYLHEGKQYIVVAVGGSDHPAEYVALGLP
jgi:quinoprotein glucose dehydrogenase